MPTYLDPADIPWPRYPAVGDLPLARRWLETQALLGLTRTTIDAYARGLQDFLAFCARSGAPVIEATGEHLARYVGDLRQRPGPRGRAVVALDSGAGLASATLQQRLTAVRLFYDYLLDASKQGVRHEGIIRGRS
jgi:integrase/recombinase XerD